MRLRSCPWIFVLAWLAAGAAAQGGPDVFPEASAFPQGVVLAADGTPVAGATVRLAVGRGDDWNRSVAQRLARAPLPEVVSQADGTFVLPLLPAMRPIGGAFHAWNVPRGPRVWLVVEAEGFLPWREPLGQGLAGYLGSRVLLRPDTPDDPYRDVPWPPALAEIAYPWWDLEVEHPAASATRRGADLDDLVAGVGDLCPLTLVVRDEAGRLLDRAELLFSDSAWSTACVLPSRTDREGRAVLSLCEGEHWLRVHAPGCTTLPQKFVVARRADGAPSEMTLSVRAGEWVDVIATDAAGRGVPFVEVDVVAPGFGPELGMPPFQAWTDSRGRVRCSVLDRAVYIVYGDEPDPESGLHAYPLQPDDRDGPIDGPLRVPKFQPVTVVLEADALAAGGEIVRRAATGAVSMQAFWAAPTANRVVTRVLTRQHEDVRFVLERRPGLALCRADLPAAPSEPLLDLARFDRTLRRRAVLELDGGPERLVAPRVEVWWRWDAVEGSPFDDVEGQWLRRRRDGGFEVWARTDGPLDLVAEARGFSGTRFTVPARVGDSVPDLRVKLEPR